MSLPKSKNMLILGIIAFLVMSFLGLHSMPTNEYGEMANCPFMNGSANFCQMNLNEHISQWKQLFAVTIEKSLLLFLLTFLVASFVVNEKVYDKLKNQRFRNYFYQNQPEIKLFDNLIVAFSQGILNPKIYESVNI